MSPAESIPPCDLLSIGAAARASGVKVPTIRFYEEAGLLPPLPRTDGNRRLYDTAQVQRLAFIRHARELGFDLDAIRALLQLQGHPDQSCAEVDAIARARLTEVRRRIAALKALEAELDLMVRACDHGRIGDCRVIETLADHTHCRFHTETDERPAPPPHAPQTRPPQATPKRRAPR